MSHDPCNGCGELFPPDDLIPGLDGWLYCYTCKEDGTDEQTSKVESGACSQTDEASSQ